MTSELLRKQPYDSVTKGAYQKMSTSHLPVTAYTLLKLGQIHSQVFQYQLRTASLEALRHYQLLL